METIHEVIKYTHKDIDIYVKINHIKGEVSLVEIKGRSMNDVKNKGWLFVDRSLEYMNGWQNILDAMKYAIGEATKILEKDLAESSRFKDNK